MESPLLRRPTAWEVSRLPASAQRRYRLLIWLDAACNPVQAAVAHYVGDDKLGESTWACEPFDSLHDVADAAVRALDHQLTLW